MYSDRRAKQQLATGRLEDAAPKIGQLTLENDRLESALTKVGLLSATR